MKARQTSALMLAATLTAGAVLTGCAAAPAPASAPAASESTAVEESAEAVSEASEKTYYGNDISEHLDLKMYVIGDEPVMADAVEEAANKILEEKANVTLDINYIALSDYTTKYSLLLASGEDIDIIYSAGWADYNNEARKGAYQEITPEQIAQYMPQTNEGLTPVAYNSIKVGGKIYMIPSNQYYANNAAPILIRGDLREKYGMDEIDSYEKLEAYMDAVLENEEGIYPYAAATDGVELSIQMFQCKYDLFPTSLSGGKWLGYFYNDNPNPTADDLVWQYTTDEYLKYVQLAKSWADKGYWSKNAVSNTISPTDAFINGTSATVFWNFDTLTNVYNTVMADHPEWKPELLIRIPMAPVFLRHSARVFLSLLSLPTLSGH